MPYLPVLFGARSAKHDSEAQASTERLVNMFPESSMLEDKPVILRSCPGRTKIISGEGAPVRAMHGTGTKIYYVANSKLWSFDGTITTSLGAVEDDEGTTIALNPTEVAVVAAGKYYLYDGSTVAEIVGTAFSSFGSVDYMDGYFLFTEKDGSRHAISALNDGSSLAALDFASAEYRPDFIVRGFVDHSEWWMFGETTIEVWANAGALDYPFERIPGAQMERGCLQTNTVVKMDNSVFWVGNDRIVYRAFEYSPRRVSNHHVEAAIRASTELSAFSYIYEGHTFYSLRINGRPAWVYDAATDVWHERSLGVDFDAWDVTTTARLGTAWYAGDNTGNISKIDRVFRENGATMLRTAQSNNLWLAGNRFTVNKVDILLGAGTSGDAMFSYTTDRGRTWSSEQVMTVGATGDYDKMFSFHGLGMMRNFAVRIRMSDNVDFSINHAGIEIA